MKNQGHTPKLSVAKEAPLLYREGVDGKAKLSQEAVEELRLMEEALAPLPEPATKEDRQREAVRQARLRYQSRIEAEKYRKKHRIRKA